MILKEWLVEKTQTEISFETTTFFRHVHGLPLAFLHEKIARMIGNIVGFIHPNSINRRSVVANRFLQFRVEIKVKDPLPADFFLDRINGTMFGFNSNWKD